MVTIHEVLRLKRFNNFRLVAGANGLDRPVGRAGFIDHETAEDMKEIAYEDEMIFSNLPLLKDHPEEMKDLVEALIHAKTACFALKTRFFKEVPEDVIELANRYNYPVFLFDDTYIEKLILDIDEVVNHQKYIEKRIRLVDEIRSGTLSTHQIRAHANELNPYFRDYFMVCMLNPKRPSAKLDLSIVEQLIGSESMVMPFRKGYLMMITKPMSFKVAPILQMLKIENDFYIGISDLFEDLTKLDMALEQALAALKYGCYKNKNTTSIKEMGIFQLLLPLMQDPILSRYYEQYVRTLEIYDQKHNSELLSTAVAFIAADGDIKQAADKMFQHQNTIRYRIRKIKSLLKFDCLEGMQYETLAIAIHLYNLHRHRDKFSLL